MGKIIKIKNPSVPDGEETVLTTKYSSGTALTVRNNDGWVDGDVAVNGMPGDEKTEAGVVTGVTSSNQIDILAALKFQHNQDTPILKSRYNQISLERKASGGSYAEITEGKKDIQWDERDGLTKVSVAAGVDSDTYRWRLYNTRLAEYSDYSGELPGTGLTPFYAGFIIAKIRKFAKIPAELGLTDTDILGFLNNGQKDVDTQYTRWWFTLVQDSDSTRKQAVAGTFKYDLPSTFRAMDVVKCYDTNSQLYNLFFKPLLDFDVLLGNQATTVRSDSTRNWTIAPPDSSNEVGYFEVYPIPLSTTNYFYRRYYQYLPTLTNFASRTLIPVPDTLFNWGMYETMQFIGNGTESDKYLKKYQRNVDQLKQFQRRQVGQQEFMRFEGQKGYLSHFGAPTNSGDTARENNW